MTLRAYLIMRRQNGTDLVRVASFHIAHTLEGHDRLYGHHVLRCIGSPDPKVETDVTYQVGWFDHGLEVSDRHPLVRRDGAQKLMRGDVIEVDETFFRPDQEHGRG